MMQRTIFTYSARLHYSKSLLNIIQGASQSRHISYSLGLPLKYFLYGNDKFRFVSNFLSYIFYPTHFKYSYANTHNEVDNLSRFILSESSRDHVSGKIDGMKKTISFLLSKGYSEQDIKEKFLEYLKSDDCSYVKMCMLADIDSNIAVLLPLLSLSEPILKLVAQKSVNDKQCIKAFSNRILYLSHHLELEPSQLIPVLAKHPRLLTIKFARLENKMRILKDANIDSKYIVKDLWIFNYTEDTLSNRIQAALKAGVELKPWMLRCSERFFQSMLEKYVETQRILRGDDVYTYLAKKLDCSPNYVSHMMERNKLLKTINVPKLEQVINFLYQKGYTAEEIRLFPRVFCSSVKTLEKRFEVFKHVKQTLPTLAQLCLSNKNAKSRLEKYIE